MTGQFDLFGPPDPEPKPYFAATYCMDCRKHDIHCKCVYTCPQGCVHHEAGLNQAIADHEAEREGRPFLCKDCERIIQMNDCKPHRYCMNCLPDRMKPESPAPEPCGNKPSPNGDDDVYRKQTKQLYSEGYKAGVQAAIDDEEDPSLGAAYGDNVCEADIPDAHRGIFDQLAECGHPEALTVTTRNPKNVALYRRCQACAYYEHVKGKPYVKPERIPCEHHSICSHYLELPGEKNRGLCLDCYDPALEEALAVLNPDKVPDMAKACNLPKEVLGTPGPADGHLLYGRLLPKAPPRAPASPETTASAMNRLTDTSTEEDWN